MATKDQIKKAILKVAGNPTSGPIAGLADEMAEAIAKLDEPDSARGSQKRVTGPTETRVLYAVEPDEK